jgi:hypothetical protein
VLALAALAVVRFGLQLAVGPEYDSNANRAEVVAGSESPDVAVGSFLLRTAANGQLAWKSGDNLLRLSGTLAGKIYFNPAVFDQDTLAIQLAAEDRIRVARFLHLAIAGDYYDSFQLDVPPYRHRDFRSGTAQARVYFVDPLGEVALSGGYRGFDYKPDPYFAFQAAVASASAITRIHVGANEDHEIDVAAGYHLERRFFSGLIQELDGRQCPPGHPIVDACLQAGTVDRQDWFHEGGLELTYVGPLLVGAGYGLQLNLSNSFGQGLLRQLVSFKLGYRLPWNLYATLKAQLYVTRYLDPVLLDHAFQSITFISIEDENRNSVLVDLERPIGATGLAINARYSVYTNELSPSPVSFLRQVIFLGLTYRVGAR